LTTARLGEALLVDLTSDYDEMTRPVDVSYRLIAEYATDMISLHSETGVYTFVSPASVALLGFSQIEMVGTNPYNLFHDDDVARIAEHHVANLKSPSAPPITYRLRCKDGLYKWVETTSRTIATLEGRKTIICITRDVSERENLVRELEAANAKLIELSKQDELSGISNRRSFNEKLSSLLLESERGRSFALIMCDIDHFKGLNDTWGHAVGDAVIVAVAKLLAEECRRVDVVCRHGGDEFAVLLPGGQMTGALVLAKRIRQSIAEMKFDHGSITASFGVEAVLGTSDTAKEIVARADSALYVAKRNGRNCVVPFDRSISTGQSPG
jgi:diguanylate cyclase (GGDEF)-like protein/PAS domain S-box-containing protein